MFVRLNSLRWLQSARVSSWLGAYCCLSGILLQCVSLGSSSRGMDREDARQDRGRGALRVC